MSHPHAGADKSFVDTIRALISNRAAPGRSDEDVAVKDDDQDAPPDAPEAEDLAAKIRSATEGTDEAAGDDDDLDAALTETEFEWPGSDPSATDDAPEDLSDAAYLREDDPDDGWDDDDEDADEVTDNVVQMHPVAPANSADEPDADEAPDDAEFDDDAIAASVRNAVADLPERPVARQDVATEEDVSQAEDDAASEPEDGQSEDMRAGDDGAEDTAPDGEAEDEVDDPDDDDRAEAAGEAGDPDWAADEMPDADAAPDQMTVADGAEDDDLSDDVTDDFEEAEDEDEEEAEPLRLAPTQRVGGEALELKAIHPTPEPVIPPAPLPLTGGSGGDEALRNRIAQVVRQELGALIDRRIDSRLRDLLGEDLSRIRDRTRDEDEGDDDAEDDD